MTTNEEFRKLIDSKGYDTRPDPRLNQDSRFIGQLIGVSYTTVISWLSPTHWTGYREMPRRHLDYLKLKFERKKNHDLGKKTC